VERPAEAPAARHLHHFRAFGFIFAAGVLVRLGVFLTCYPFNPDDHWAVVRYIAEHGVPPTSELLVQAAHPPLYHTLMAPTALWFESPRPAHFLSFVFSSLNLWLVMRLVRDPQLVASRSVAIVLASLAAFLPEYVMYSGFVSNDTLTILLGTSILLTVVTYLREGTRVWRLSMLCAMAYLTKGVFLLWGPVLSGVVAWREWRSGRRTWLLTFAGFTCLWLVLGSYKYVQNLLHFGVPIIHNLDLHFDKMADQKGVWKGPVTLFDVNVVKLVKMPILVPGAPLSYPLLMYGTFWYPHIPASSYRGGVHGWWWIGSVMYVVAVLPTIAFLIGLVRILFPAGKRSAIEGLDLSILRIFAVLLLANAAVVLGAGWKYDLWSCFQSRLCFASMPAALLLGGVGIEMAGRLPAVRQAMLVSAVLCAAVGLGYFATEFLLFMGWVPLGPMLQV
jgi:hypothetical protein